MRLKKMKLWSQQHQDGLKLLLAAYKDNISLAECPLCDVISCDDCYWTIFEKVGEKRYRKPCIAWWVDNNPKEYLGNNISRDRELLNPDLIRLRIPMLEKAIRFWEEQQESLK